MRRNNVIVLVDLNSLIEKRKKTHTHRDPNLIFLNYA